MSAENARLAKELQGAKANGMIQEHIISSGHNPQDRDTIVRVIMENSALSTENARLRAERDKAVEDLLATARNGACSTCQHMVDDTCPGCESHYPNYQRRGTVGKA